MFTGLRATNSMGEGLDLPLGDYSSGYLVVDVDGLGPVKAAFTTTQLANTAGSQFRSSVRESRNVVITLGLRPDFVASSGQSLRDGLYRFFSPGEIVTLGVFMDGEILGQLVGRTETVDPEIFVKKPSVVISVLCFDPDIVGAQVTTDTWASHATTTRAVEYSGTVPTGFVLSSEALTGDVSAIEIRNQSSLADTYFNFADSLLTGDVVRFSTVKGSKYAKRSRDSAEKSVLYGVPASAVWGVLYPGSNTIRVKHTGTAFDYSLSYFPRYGGI